MKKTFLKILALALSVMMCLSLCTVAFAVGETITDVSLNLQTDSLTVSSEKQTVTATMDLTISGGETIAARGVSYKMSLPTGWTLESYSFPAAAAFQSATTTAGVWAIMSGATDISSIGTLVFGIPADTAAGTYTISISEVKVNDADNQVLFSNGAASATLTIAEASTDVPSTGAALSAESLALTVGETETLTASLLPADTTETISSSIQWSSSNTEVATVADGVVTAVAAGEATITAVITTSAGTSYTKTCDVTVTAGEQPPEPVSPYTVTISDGVEDTAEVKAGDPVTMNLSVSGGAFGGAEGTVTYDPTLFTYVGATAAAGSGEVNSNVTVNGGTITYHVENTADYASGDTFLTLSFTANSVNATQTGDFTLGTTSTASKEIVLNSETAYEAAVVNDSVKILASYTVTLKNEDGTTAYTLTVLDGEKVTINDITDPVKDNYDFVGWTDGTNTYTTEELAGLEITGSLELIAKFEQKTFIVTLHEDYVNGYTLVLVTNVNSDSSAVYTYDGNVMYKDELHGGYTWLVQGTADPSLVSAAAAGTEVAGTIADSRDVNASGLVGYEDKLAVWYCVKLTNYDPISDMAAYLRADVDKDNTVTVSDLEALREIPTQEP